LRFPTTLENEILTDVASVYLGIGWLVLDAYRRTQDEPVTDKKNGRTYVKVVEENLGYLTPEEFAYVLAKRSLAFDEAPHRLLTSLAAREALRAGCSRALLDYRTPPLRDSGLVRRAVYRRRLRRAQAGRPGFAVGGRSDQGYRFEAAEATRVVFACPVCGQNLRLPTGRGRLSARCAVCESTLDCET
jgi:hypothetical protein